MKRRINFFISFFFMWGILTVEHDAMAETALIQRDILFGNPEVAQVRISHDGKWLSYLKPRDGVMNIWVKNLETGDEKPITHEMKRGIPAYFWAYNNETILYVMDHEGDENWNLLKADVLSGEASALTDYQQVKVNVVSLSYKHPDEIVIGVNDRAKEWHDLYKLNIKTGKKEKILENNRFTSFVLDVDFTLRALREEQQDGSVIYFKPKEDGSFDPFMTVSFDDSEGTMPLDYDAQKKILYMIDSRDRDTSAFVAFHEEEGKFEELFHTKQSDVSGILFEPKNAHPIAVTTEYLKNKSVPLDPSYQEDFDLFSKSFKEETFGIVAETLDNKKWILGVMAPQHSIHYYLYDRDQKSLTLLLKGNSSLDALPLRPMETIEIKARDGLVLPSYLTMPESREADTKVPLVLVVHGGPWARDSWGYNALHQWLANRGYAALSVNYRSSTGFGKNFLLKGNGEWSRKMHDDLIDSIDWVLQNKNVDPQRIAILGGSYGGYATLVGLTFTPDIFACGVDIVGPSNLITLIESFPPYWKPLRDSTIKRIGGTPDTEEGRAFLTKCSPLTYVDNIKKPLLIGQGKNDPRVKQQESDQIVRAMREKKIPVEYVVFPDEGHGFHRPQNRIAFWALTEEFLARYLNGRCEPIKGEIKASTAQIS